MDEQPQNQFPQTNSPQRPTLWEANPKLKSLLLVLIVVFLLSGLGLAGLSLWSQQYRTKLYQETQAGLPKHEVKAVATTTLDTMGWQIYKNDEYGFELSVPADFVEKDGLFSSEETRKQTEENIQNCTGKGTGTCIPEEPSYDMKFVFSKQSDQNKDFISSSTTVTLGGNVWTRYVDNGLESEVSYEIQANQGYLIFSFVGDNFEDTFKQILSTFKFTDSTDTSTWKTYKNDEYRFEFQYPSDFTVRKSTATSTYLNLSNGSDSERITLQVLNQKFDPNNIQGIYGKIDDVKLESHNGISWYSFYGKEICSGRSFERPLDQLTLYFDFTNCTDEEVNTSIIDDHFIEKVLNTFKFTK